MTVLPSQPLLTASRPGVSSAAGFAAACLCVALLAALLAGFVPIGFSIVTVFLFAGPHNWLEFRYFLSKMPAHWGPMKPFFALAIGGVLLLTTGFLLLPVLGRQFAWDDAQWTFASATWNSALVAWVSVLVWMRGRQPPVRDWSLALPAGCLLIAAIWLFPLAWEIGLVYLHPMIAIVFLDRELARRRPAWRRTYHLCLAVIPLLVGVLWYRLADAPPLAGNDMLTMRITNHAGAGVFANVSPHLLVATHTFLEMLHYGVWIAAIPLLAMRTAPWKLSSVPLARRSTGWRTVVIGLLATGGLVVLTLWAAFLGNYPLTRDIYFAVAIAHVLAEAPFLLRVL